MERNERTSLRGLVGLQFLFCLRIGRPEAVRHYKLTLIHRMELSYLQYAAICIGFFAGLAAAGWLMERLAKVLHKRFGGDESTYLFRMVIVVIIMFLIWVYVSNH